MARGHVAHLPKIDTKYRQLKQIHTDNNPIQTLQPMFLPEQGNMRLDTK